MFIVKPETEDALMAARELLVHYRAVDVEEYKFPKYNPVTILVARGGNDLHLAEMAFQMNFHQVGNVCIQCVLGGETACGHLTFSKPINSAF